MGASSPIKVSRLSEIAESLGFVYLAALGLDEFDNNRELHQQRLSAWQESGYAGQMEYMRRDPALFVDLPKFLSSYKSVVQFLVPYAQNSDISQACPPDHGKVARYAWGRDYHKVVPKKLRRLVEAVAMEFPNADLSDYRVFTDAVPLLERAMAADGGLGFIGKNSMLIRAGFGSYGFLAEILWSLDIEDDYEGDVKGNCGTCSRCMSSCPTEAFVGEKILDSRRCISYLTIEKRGAFSEWEAQALGDWLFGCDVCQEVCPFNHSVKSDLSLPEFSMQAGAGSSLCLADLFQISDPQSFTKRFAGTAIMRAKRDGLLRNAAAVAANTRSLESCDAMIDCYLVEDSPLIRGEIVKSLNRLKEYADGRIMRRINKVIDV